MQAKPNPFPGETLDSDGHVYIHPDVFREIFPELSFGYNFEFLDGYVKHPEYKERRAKNRAELLQWFDANAAKAASNASPVP